MIKDNLKFERVRTQKEDEKIIWKETDVIKLFVFKLNKKKKERNVTNEKTNKNKFRHNLFIQKI